MHWLGALASRMFLPTRRFVTWRATHQSHFQLRLSNRNWLTSSPPHSHLRSWLWRPNTLLYVEPYPTSQGWNLYNESRFREPVPRTSRWVSRGLITQPHNDGLFRLPRTNLDLFAPPIGGNLFLFNDLLPWRSATAPTPYLNLGGNQDWFWISALAPCPGPFFLQVDGALSFPPLQTEEPQSQWHTLRSAKLRSLFQWRKACGGSMSRGGAAPPPKPTPEIPPETPTPSRPGTPTVESGSSSRSSSLSASSRSTTVGSSSSSLRPKSKSSSSDDHGVDWDW